MRFLYRAVEYAINGHLISFGMPGIAVVDANKQPPPRDHPQFRIKPPSGAQ